MKSTISFDIETGPLADDVLLAINGPFDPSSVKINKKDLVNEDAIIAEAKANYIVELREKAALDPLTGRVLAIGYGYIEDDDDPEIDHNDADERAILTKFWATARLSIGGSSRMVGFNSGDFDLPFLVGRSRLLGVDIPTGLLVSNDRYWNSCFVDLMKIWTCHQYGKRVSLNKLAVAFGIGGKTEDGAFFYQLWNGDKAQRERALAYLCNDIFMTSQLAKKLGVC